MLQKQYRLPTMHEKTDEFVLPTVIEKDGKPVATVSDKDSVVFFNFRPDRAREITRAFCDDDFKGFRERKETGYHIRMLHRV
jgi:2,3-bisphosphoglycerate-independent phosphoglycerate mutase